MKKIDLKVMPIVCILVTLFAAYILLWSNSRIAIQATGSIYPEVIFEGEYKIGEGVWQEYRQGIHLPSNQGDVTLKGILIKQLPGSKEQVGNVCQEEIVAFYCDHLMVTIWEENREPFILESEIPKYEITCAKIWQFYRYQGEETREIEIRIHNPHQFGNVNAVDDMLNNMYIYLGYEFEEDRINEGAIQRIQGTIFLLGACCMLGISLFAGRIHIGVNHYFWKLGLLMVFAGGYIILNSENVNLWRPNYTFNTAALGICMMLYQYLLTVLITHVLGEKTKKFGQLVVHLSGLFPAVFVIASLLVDIHFYATWGIWVVLESLVSLILLFGIWYDAKDTDYPKRLLQTAATVPLLGFLLDAIATAIGWWQGGNISLLVFFIYALIVFVIVVRIVPQKINDAARAKELEEQQRKLQQELKDRRVSVMMSQIRTHFIFNVMTIISGLCNTDPAKADDALILFARYLRKNMAIMDRDEPILFSQELAHLEDYVSLEKMRFGEKIKFEKQLEVTDFKLPPLTIQPLVENAIKHGLLTTGKKGTVTLSSKEIEGMIQIRIEDDGIGFALEALEKEEAVGIRNVRYRVENMVGGTLTINSAVGKGTRAEICIPRR